MSWNLRRAAIVLLAPIVAASAVWLDQGHAQDKGVKKAVPIPAGVVPPPPPGGPGGQPPAGGALVERNSRLNPDGFLNNGIHLVKDEKRRGKAIEAAIDYINDENWPVATESLQKLLEIDEDVFVRLKRANAEGEEVYVWVSVKQEADRLLAALPPAGKDFYKTAYGAKAAGLLKKAKKNGDPGLLNDIMKKYGHTDAGAEAIKLLGDYKFDRGEYMPALLCYSKLINRVGAEKVAVAILAKAAWAAHLAPPSASDKKNTVTTTTVFSEKALWKMLRARTREVPFGEQAVSVGELQEYVAKLDRTHFEPNAADALLYRATVSRGNQLAGGPAYMRREWGISLLYDKNEWQTSASKARSHIHSAKDALKRQNQPIIPAFSPIALLAHNHKGEKQPLVIYKTFFGVFAVDPRNGDLAWMSPSNLSLQKMLCSTGQTQQNMAAWLNFYQNQYPQICFENSTVGTLSSDGEFVYVVEDLAVPPMPQLNSNNMRFRGRIPNRPSFGDKEEDAVAHNRLFALSLARSGALSWALGDSDKDPLPDHYFLGPPLPLAGKLYLLADKQQEIRLICLETIKVRQRNGEMKTVPRLVSTQTLGITQEKMQNDPLRRTWAAHLAYGEGILVCPTNAGAVFGVNLLENSLIWAYPYRDKNEARVPQPQQIMNGRMFRRGMPPPGAWIGPDGRLHTKANAQNSWKVTAPIISNGKVVFTAPDARSLHCINLRDGSPVWALPKRDDDLYLGNVYNGKVLIVGKKHVRALSLANGETLWTLETGMPSGQGIGSDNVYYLPLRESAQDKGPQIVGIDMDRGKIVSRSKSQPSAPDADDADVPGNLLFAQGKVISVTAYGGKEEGEIIAYPQLRVKLAEMDDLIAKNPNDPKALTERGELRLDKGDLSGAIEDLSIALKNNPDKETRVKARAKLYDTLTAYIADHFDDAEKYLPEYEELCNFDLDGATGEERAQLQAEQRRRRATYLWLVGKGREEQGRLVEAFEKYQQFAQEAGKQSELVPAVDDRQVKVAPDVWSRGRILAMMNKAKPEERRPLEKVIADKWDQLRQTNDLPELRAFVRMFGPVCDAGKEARLELVERLMERKDNGEEHPLLEAELELNQFRTGRHRPELAARATEALARLYTRKGLLEDAAYCYRKLGKEYADIVIRDGKTGRQIYEDDAATDKRLLPYLDDPQPLGSVQRFLYKKQRPEYRKTFPMPAGGKLFQFEHSGEDLPFFRRHVVGLNFNGNRFTLLDRNLEDDNQLPKVVWSERLSNTSSFETLSRQVLGDPTKHQQRQFVRRIPGGAMVVVNNNTPNPYSRFPYETVGHLIVLPLGRRLFGIDPVNHRLLWERDLLKKSSGPVSAHQSEHSTWDQNIALALDPRDGSVLVTYPNVGWAQRLGQVSPFQGQTICMQTAKALSALDPLTGRTLWSRMDVNPRNYLFSDEDYVFVVEVDNQNNPNATRVFRAADGMSVPAPDFAALFAKRLQVFGRYLLLSETGPTNGVVVWLYDAASGQDVWKRHFAAGSIVAHSEDAAHAGVVEPDGKVHVLDLRACREVMSGEMSIPAEQLKNVQSFHLLSDRRHFYFASQTAARNGVVPGGVAASNVMTQLGMRTVPVNGFLHAFARDSGDHLWWFRVENQHLILDQFQDLPLIFFTSRASRIQNLAPGMRRLGASPVEVTSIQKRDARLVFAEKLPANSTNFFGVRIDPRTRRVELLSQQLKITYYPKPDGDKKGQPAAAAPPRRGTPKPASLPPKSATRVLRPVFERARIREITPPLPPG